MDYATIVSMKAGDTASYQGETIKNKGTVWYKVSFKGNTGWASSKHVEVVKFASYFHNQNYA